MRGLAVRRYTASDEPAVLGLLQTSLGWLADERHTAFFRWKHRDNPFGPSPAWVALDGERLVGLRVLLRWEFESGDDVVRAARAVDTATDPAYQGRGIFSALTLHAIDDLSGQLGAFDRLEKAAAPGERWSRYDRVLGGCAFFAGR